MARDFVKKFAENISFCIRENITYTGANACSSLKNFAKFAKNIIYFATILQQKQEEAGVFAKM